VRAAIEKVALRRRIEAQRHELERSQNQLRVTLASIGDAVIATDLAGDVTFMNAVAEGLTGWSSEAARGRPLAEVFVIVHEDTRQPGENPALRALREGRIVGLANHTILIARDGVERPIDDSAAPIRDGLGEVFGAVLVFRDVSERHRTEQSLLLQSRVLDSMTEGVSVADEAGLIFYTNPAEDRMFGFARGELIGRRLTVGSAYADAENDRRMREVHEQLAATGVWAGEWRNVRKDGTTFTTHARITTLVAAGRRCLVRVQEDVSDRHRLEDELQQRVTELALAHRRKDEFLAMLAHELRNPLTPIKNALHILELRSRDVPTVERMRELMTRQVRHFGRLVDDLLDVSRVTQGKLTLRPERLDLARLARDCGADHQAEFQRARVALTVDSPETPVWVTGDTTRLNQIVDNLLSNALKFTNPGGTVVLTVRCDGAQAELAVRDDGIGIEPEVLTTVFDVFAQADKSLARSPGGLGLGLAIVKGLAQMHGGSVRAHSEGLGHGTELTLSLPLQQEPPALTPASAPRTRPSRRQRILVVEDNRDSAESLRILLEVSGYEVRVADTGTEGLRVAVEWQPDAVLCDIGLPEMDGFAVARALRSDPRTASATLIAVTGYGREEDVAAARAAGFDEHLMKPADPAKLLEKLAAGAS
jgi:PAS domain S-box-containing protein